MGQIILLILLLFLPSLLLADEIINARGDTLHCKITSSSETYVYYELKNQNKEILKSEVVSFIFSSADELKLKNDEIILCKVIKKKGRDVEIAKDSSIQLIPNNKIAQVDYNSGPKISIKYLPTTGKQFKNESNNFVWTGSFKSHIYLGFNFAFALNTPSSNQLFNTSKYNVKTAIKFGGEIYYAISENIHLGIGGQILSLDREVNGSSISDDLSYSFLFTSLKAGGFSNSIKSLFIYGGLDLGSFTGKEVISGSNSIDISSTTLAGRLKFGIEYFAKGNFSIYTDISYLFAKLNDLEISGVTMEGSSLDFSGVAFTFGINIHFPSS